MYVRIQFGDEVHFIRDLSRRAAVSALRISIEEKTGVPPARQRLIHKGKQLEDGQTLFEYDVNYKDVITMIEKREEVDKEEKDEERKEDEEGLETIPPVEEYFCDHCLNDQTKDCEECGCVVCHGKEDPAGTLMCDQCEYYYHFRCLDPPLDSVPDDDWYCPVCKTDDGEIVGAGAKPKARKSKANMPSSKKGKGATRDWGKGMATVARSKTCTKVDPHHFGPIPGVEVGMTWKYRIQCSEEGVHRPPVGGIAGSATYGGAMSIVMAGGYKGDVDNGDEFFYTGSGGRDLSGNKRTSRASSSDQTLTKSNLAIAVSCSAKLDTEKGSDAGDSWREGKPVRVVRSYKLKSEYAPEEGFRYDGIYKVVKYWPEKEEETKKKEEEETKKKKKEEENRFVIWRYLFRRDDKSSAPWTKEGKKICKENGYKCVYPEGYLETPQEKKKGKNKSGVGESGDGGVDLEEGPSGKKIKVEEETEAKYEIEDEIRALIKRDAMNKATWELVLDRTMTTKLDFTNVVEEHFQCSICQFVTLEPVTTKCGHNFCRGCFREVMTKVETKTCPNCREVLGGEAKKDDNLPNDVLSEVLLKIFPGYALGR